MRIALVRLSAMGDIIHTAASLQFIRSALPRVTIDWFVDRRFAGILEHHPQIDRLIPLDLHGLKKEPSLSLLRSLYQIVRSAGPYDLVVDVQGLIKSALVARVAGSETAGLDRASAREGVASLLYRRRYRVDCAGVAPLRFASLIAQALEIEIDEKMMARKTPCLFWHPTRDRQKLEGYFDDDRANLLVVVGASLPSKTYPPSRWTEVIRQLEKHNVLLVAGSETERQSAAKIARESSAKLLPPLDLDELKYAVGRCDLLLGGDTGPSHLAWALNRPSLLLFGSTPRSMMFETPLNRALDSGAPVHPCRFDKNDRSIERVDPKLVAREAREILQLSRSFPRSIS